MRKASIITYGCQMNVNESAKIKKMLENINYKMTEDIYEADLVILNTCTVREGAATQIYGKIGELKKIKEKKDLIIGVTGCFAQEMGKKLVEKFPVIDIIMGNQNIGKIPDAIDNLELKRKEAIVYVDNENKLPEYLEANFESNKNASIAITYGCNNFCTYCIVPYVRGRERSVPMDEIVNQAKKYIELGYKEITLLGQNVNSYGNDFDNSDNFAKLLEEICKINGDYILRFMSPHPRDFSDELIEVIARNAKISRSLHLPLQAGSTKTLGMMNRGYSKDEYLHLAQKIKDKIKGVSLTTDIIVGFPGESEEDFLDTLDVVEKVAFEMSFMFMYSIRNGTKAATMPNQVDDKIKNERLQRLMKVQNECTLNISKSYLGKIERILVEGTSKKNAEMLTGRTSTNKIVLFKGDADLKGSFVNIKINQCNTWTLYGEII